MRPNDAAADAPPAGESDLSTRQRLRAMGMDAHLRDPLRICMLSYHTCPLAAPGGKESGGMNVYVRELSRQLGRRGILVDCFTRSQNPAVPHIPDTDLGPNVRLIHVVAGPERPLSKAESWKALPQFTRGIRAFMAAEGLRCDRYHAHYWMSGQAAMDLVDAELASGREVPYVQMFHTLGAMKDLSKRQDVEAEIAPRIGVEKEIATRADRIVAATDIDRRHLIDHYSAAADKIATIPPGVDLERFRPMDRDHARDNLGLAPDHKMVLFVGRPDPIKGLGTLVKAMAKVIELDPHLVEDSCLCVVGADVADDPALMDAEMARIDELRHSLGIQDFVTFLGPRGQDELASYYNAAQVVVVPSRYESFGMVALEAMACGTPVIASDVGGLSTLIQDGHTGYLVPYGDVDAMVERLIPVLADPGLCDCLGQHGRAQAEAYAWAAVADQIDDLYRGLKSV